MGYFGWRSGAVKVLQVDSNKGPSIVFGVNTSLASVLAEYPSVAVGTVYVSTAGKIYLKVANAGATTDWERVTTTNVN